MSKILLIEDNEMNPDMLSRRFCQMLGGDITVSSTVEFAHTNGPEQRVGSHKIRLGSTC
jgi:hypothetical protein